MIAVLDDFTGAVAPILNNNFRPHVRRIAKRTPSRWATETRKIPAGTSPLASGRTIDYDHAIMPHCVEQMDSADDPQIRTIVIWAAIRDGKTNGVCLNIFGRTVTDDPGNIYSVHPIADDVAKFSNDDIEPMINACLGDYFVEKKSRDSGRTVSYKRFIGGSLRIVSAGSVTKFRGTSVKVLFLHELDALNPESIYKAFGRTTGFGDAVIVEESTGTIAATFDQEGRKVYNSRIEEAYDQGDKRKWFGPCRRCDALQWLKYDRFWWPTGKMEKAVYLCERCEAAHNEKQWRDFQYAARWFPTAGLNAEQEMDIAAHHTKARALDPTVRSYWRNGFNRLLPIGKGFRTALHEIVAKGEAAKTSPAKLKIWKQEEAAELWDPSVEGELPPAWKPLFDRREPYGKDDGTLIVPAGALVIMASVDVHKNRLELEWEGWGRNEENWGLDYVVIDGEVEDDAVWTELHRELLRKLPHEIGAEVSLSFAFIDAGKWPEWVYRFLRRMSGVAAYKGDPLPGSPLRGKVRACRGSSLFPHPIIDTKYKSIAKQLQGHWIGTDAAKDLIYSRLRMELPVDGTVPDGWTHFPLSYGPTYFEMLTAERVTISYQRGEEIRRYINPEHLRNETLDLRVYNLAAFRMRPRWNFDQIEADLKKQAEENKPKRVERRIETQPAPTMAQRRGGLGRGWSL